MTSEPRRLILASASPRRRSLLASVGFSFDISPSEVDEEAFFAQFGHLTPTEIAPTLAKEKALDIARNTSGNALVIGADTIVVLNGHILNKPVDEADAIRMLMLLSGRTHTVYTGIAVVEVDNGQIGEVVTDFGATDVKFTPLTREIAEAYVETGEPMDKAGAYGIQQKGAVLIERIDGDYFNVVGLPLNKLAGLLAKYDISVWG